MCWPRYSRRYLLVILGLLGAQRGSGHGLTALSPASLVYPRCPQLELALALALALGVCVPVASSCTTTRLLPYPI